MVVNLWTAVHAFILRTLTLLSVDEIKDIVLKKDLEKKFYF